MNKQNMYEIINRHRSKLMGAAALWILVFHAWQPVFTDYFLLSRFEKVFKRLGFCGVDIFMLLSGIGLTYSILKGSRKRFYFNRIKRVIIPFLLVAMIRFFLDDWSITTLLGNISGFNFYSKSIYSFIWFVPAFLTLNFLFPIYYSFFRKASNKRIFTACTILIWLTCSLLLKPFMREDLYGFTNRIPIFVIGVLIGWQSQNEHWEADRQTIVFGIVMLLTGAWLGYLANFNDLELIVPVSNCCLPNILMSCALMILIPLLMEFLQNKVSIVGKILGFFGMFSFELYCVQEWPGTKPIKYINKFCGNLLTNIIILFLFTLMAYIVHIVVNKLWSLLDKKTGSKGEA